MKLKELQESKLIFLHPSGRAVEIGLCGNKTVKRDNKCDLNLLFSAGSVKFGVPIYFTEDNYEVDFKGSVYAKPIKTGDNDDKWSAGQIIGKDTTIKIK